MKVLLIYPNIVSSPKDISTGLATISAVLKQSNHQVKLIDATFKISDKEIIKKVKEFNPKLIAMTVASNDYDYAVHIAKLLKRFNIPLLAGGFHALIAAEDLIDYFDFVCVGEGEYSILELVNKLEKKTKIDDVKNLWIKKKGYIVKNPLAKLIQDINKIPFPDRSIFNYQKYINWNRGLATFISTRGCPYQCTYCINHFLMKKYKNQKYIRFRSVDNLLKEIKQVITNYNVKAIEFYDDSFNLNKKRVLEFCKKYKKNINLPFYINAQINSLDKEMLYHLKKAGCKRVSLGIECGNEKIRNKLLKRNMSNKQIINVFKWCKEISLETYAFNMIGMPYETKKQIKETIKLNKIIQPDYIGVSIFNAYKGTEIYNFCKDNNLLKDNVKDYFKGSNIKTNLTERQLRNLRDSFGFKVYLKNNPLRAIADLFDKKLYKFPYYTLIRSKLISIVRN